MNLKTDIEAIPESIEPAWKTQLRATHIRKKDHATSVTAIFDLAADFANANPQDGVFAYLVKKIVDLVAKLDVTEYEWELLDAMLLRAAVGEPACMPTVLRIFEQNNRVPLNAVDALSSICLTHSALQQASEVAWALWAAKRLDVTLPQSVADAVEMVDDDVVALTALHLHQVNLLPQPVNNFALWRTYINALSLYSDHWLLAYEAFVQTWLPTTDQQDHVSNSHYFSILKAGNVRFFDTSDDIEVPEESGYEEEGDYDSDDEEEDDEEDEDDEEEGPRSRGTRY